MRLQFVLKPAFLLIALLLLINSCDSPEPAPDPDTNAGSVIQLDDNNKLTVYKNQTNDANADALQAQLINTKEKYTLNIYGHFDAQKNPIGNKLSTISFRKDNNDTTIYLLLSPNTGKLQTAYMDVKGVKQPWVIRHEYLADNDSAVQISVHEYDWTLQKSILKYESFFENKNNAIEELPIYGLRKGSVAGIGTDLALGLAVGVGVANLVYGTAATAAVFGSVIAVIGAAGPIVAITGAVLAVEFLVGKVANAGELKPSEFPYPKGTPATNPATGNNNPTPNTELSGCGRIEFQAAMGPEGHIMISGVEGGVSPYEYKIGNSGYDGNPVTAPYEDGTYIITVRDAKGCSATKGVSLKRDEDIVSKLINGSPWKVTSYSIYGTNFFNFESRGSKTCYPDGVTDKERMVEGSTFTLSNSSARFNLRHELHTYNCSTNSYVISYHNNWSNTAQWKIDEASGRFILIYSPEVTAQLSITEAGGKIMFNGVTSSEGESASFSFTLEK